MSENKVEETPAAEEVPVVVVPKERAKKFKEANGYSYTMSKLLKANGCNSITEYRILRNKKKKEKRLAERATHRRILMEFEGKKKPKDKKAADAPKKTEEKKK